MKKLIAVLAAVLIMTLGFAGCNNDPLSTSGGSEAASTTSSVNVENKTYDDTLAGLEELFIDKGYITVEDNRSNVTEMDAALIGAKEGNRYESTINGTVVVVELYSYDSDNPDDKGQEIISSVKEKGEFQILDLDPTKAYLSDNEKYLMVYTDKSNPEEGSENHTRMQKAIETLKAF